MPDPAVLAARPAPAGCFLPVVYEDADLLVLHKPAGVPSLPHAPDETGTAVSAALARDPGLPASGRSALEPGLLHRLDTGTSGLLAFARTREAFERLREAWRAREVHKVYRAVCGRSDPSSPALRAGQTLDRPIGRSPKSSRRVLVQPAPPRRPPRIRGPWMPALTRVLAMREPGSDLLDLTLCIETGVMHQIRAHLADAGWPVLGDPVYGARSRGQPSPAPSPPSPPAPSTQPTRLWLHAWKLTLPMRDGARLTLVAELPEGWPQSDRRDG